MILNLINFLGGSKPRKENDYTEEEANAKINADNRSDGDLQETGGQDEGPDMDE